MSLIDEMKPIFTKRGLTLFSTGVLGGLMWILHFILEIKALEAVNLEPIYILFHLGALPLGSIFYLIYSSQHDIKITYIASSTLLVISLIGLVVGREPGFVIFCLFIAGFCNGNIIPMIFLLLKPFFKNLEYNGRIFFLIYIGVVSVSIVETVVDFIGNEIVEIFYLIILLLFTIIAFYLGQEKSTETYKQEKSKLYFRKEIFPIPVHFLSFFIGFFLTNVYFTAILIFSNTTLTDIVERIPSYWSIFIFVLFFISLLACIPSGFLYDKIGRRWSILIGFYLEAIAFIAFFIITLFPDFFPTSVEDTFLLIVLPSIAGIGLPLGLYGAILVVFFEQAPKGYSSVHGGVAGIFFGFGMVSGVVLNSVIEPLIEIQPVLLPMVMIFAYFTATTIIFQTEEPLPSKAELEWRKSVEHILVLSQAGIPLYSQSLQDQEPVADVILAGGAIIGISTIVNEITKMKDLKVIKQENYCIMLEAGFHVILAVLTSKDLKIIREKMIDFVSEFESFFSDLLKVWKGDTEAFLPTKRLVENHFGS